MISIYETQVQYVENYIRQNFDSLVLQSNPSGFVRINIPLSEYIDHPQGSITKLRLNFWSSDSGLKVEDESLHSHPFYFESLILNGGYTHELYEEHQEGKSYNWYEVTRTSKSKSPKLMGTKNLKLVKTETTQKSDVVKVPKDLIHQILCYSPDTLTMNAVFEESEISKFECYKNSKVLESETDFVRVEPKNKDLLKEKILSLVSGYNQTVLTNKMY